MSIELSFDCIIKPNNPTNPLGQLDWLESTLRQAEQAGESAFIIGHIPPAANYFNSEASRRYNALIDRFNNTIKGQFYGHSHSDEWKLIHEYFNKTNVVGIVHTCGSLSTNAYRNPGFRVYNMYDDTHLPIDYTLYYLNLSKANRLPNNTTPEFEFGYNASSFYNLSHLAEFDKFNGALERMMVDDDFFNQIQKVFFGYGDPHIYFSPKPSNSPFTKVDDDLRYFLNCRYKEDVFETYLGCMGNRKSWESMDSAMHFIERLSGKWHTRKEFN